MQKIIIKNFRQITNAEIEIKKLLLLIGEQASGKSTIAKLIYFFKSLKEDYFNLVYENAHRSEYLEKNFIEIVTYKFRIYFGNIRELSDDFEIIFYYNYISENSPENKYLIISKRKKGFFYLNFIPDNSPESEHLRLFKDVPLHVQFEPIEFKIIFFRAQKIADEIAAFTNSQQGTSETNYLVIERAKMRFINDLKSRVNELFYDNYSPQFFPAGRNITVSFPEQFQASFLSGLRSTNLPPKSVDLMLMKSFILHSKFLYDYFRGNNFSNEIRANNQSPIAIDALNFFMRHAEYILQGKYDNVDGIEKIVLGKNNSISLNIASSGQQEVVRIMQDLLYILVENQKSFRVLEEPEAHLYPKAQKNLMELIALIINKTQSQFIITTHSPYLLSILNNLLMYSVVSNNNPNAMKDIKEHFGTVNLKENDDEKINLTQNQVQAYSLNINDENYCTSIMDTETGLIGDNFLDGITEELNNDFNVLYHLNFQNR